LIKEEDKMALEKQLDQYQKLWKKRKATVSDIDYVLYLTTYCDWISFVKSIKQ
jgi:hypothetical protein